MRLAIFIFLFSVAAQAGENTLQALGPALDSLVQLPLAENQSALFHDPDGRFIGIIGDSSEWLGGSDASLKTDSYTSLRETIWKNSGTAFQSQVPLRTTSEGSFKVTRARLLLRDGGATIVVNEEHWIAPDRSSYSVFLVSLVENESLALLSGQRLSQRFVKVKSTSAKSDSHWFEHLLVETAYAQSEVSRSRPGATIRGRTQARANTIDPKCENIGIKTPSRRRRLNEPPLSFWNGALSCGAGVWDAAKGIVSAFAGPSTTLTQLGMPPVVQSVLTSLSPAMFLGMRISEGLVAGTTLAVSAIRKNRSAIFMMAWEAAKKKKAQFLCLTNEAQMEVACDVIANVATVVVPGGAVVKVARFGRLAEGAAEIRMASELSEAERVVAAADRAHVPPPRPAPPVPKPVPPVTRFGNFSVLRRGPQVTRSSIVRQIRARFSNVKPGQRGIQVDLPSAPSEGINKFNLSPADTRAVNNWAESVLAAAQKAHPERPLKIQNVDIGVGFRARESFVHIDNGGTYLHGSSTLEGGTSTIMFTKSGADKIAAAETAMRAQAESGQIVVSKVVSRNADGTMNVEVGITKSEVPPRVVRLQPDNFMQPPAGTTAIFSGSDHARVSEGVSEALHASPLTGEAAGEWDRVTFFINIQPK